MRSRISKLHRLPFRHRHHDHAAEMQYHSNMRETLKILLQVRDEGVLADFAIGGAIAASFYTPAVATDRWHRPRHGAPA